MRQPNFKYRVGGSPLYELFSSHTGPGDLGWVAEDAAKDFHYRRGGMDYEWPLVFTIFDMLGNRLGQCEVERRVQPAFEAGKVTFG